MKRKTIVVIVIILLSTSFAIAMAMNYSKGQTEYKTIGEGKAEAVRAFYEEVKAINDGSISYDDIEYIAEIQGTKISKREFMVRYISRITGMIKYDNPKEDALESFKRDVWYKQFAIDNGLLPTKEEIENYSKDVKKAYAETDEGEALIKSYLEGLGMTEDEYWDYNKLCEAPYVVTHSKVEQYLEDNGLPSPDLEELECIIFDSDFYNSL